jgi:hypothetical protein
MDLGAEQMAGDVACRGRRLIGDVSALCRRMGHVRSGRHSVAKANMLLRAEDQKADDHANDQRNEENRPIELDEFHAC